MGPKRRRANEQKGKRDKFQRRNTQEEKFQRGENPKRNTTREKPKGVRAQGVGALGCWGVAACVRGEEPKRGKTRREQSEGDNKKSKIPRRNTHKERHTKGKNNTVA